MIWNGLRKVNDLEHVWEPVINSLLLDKDNENIEAFAYSMTQIKNTALTVIYVSLKCWSNMLMALCLELNWIHLIVLEFLMPFFS